MKYGEIYLVDFEPQVASEINKTRPAIIVGDENVFMHLRIQYVIPIRHYREDFAGFTVYPVLTPNKKNGLKKKSIADCLQAKSLDINRFGRKIGELTESEMQEIRNALAIPFKMNLKKGE